MHRYDTTIDSLLVTDSTAGRREEGDAPGEGGGGLGGFSDKMEPPMTLAVLPAETRFFFFFCGVVLLRTPV